MRSVRHALCCVIACATHLFVTQQSNLVNSYEAYWYPHARMSVAGPLRASLSRAAMEMCNRLQHVNPETLPISPYCRRYFASYQRRLSGVLQKSTFLLAHCLAARGGQLDRFVFLDYGGGLGSCSLLAKMAGVGTVIYNDMNAEAAEAASQLSSIVQCQCAVSWVTVALTHPSWLVTTA